MILKGDIIYDIIRRVCVYTIQMLEDSVLRMVCTVHLLMAIMIDHRPPVYDIKEIQALEVAEAEGGSANGPNALDKERNLMNEDPKWQGTTQSYSLHTIHTVLFILCKFMFNVICLIPCICRYKLCISKL